MTGEEMVSWQRWHELGRRRYQLRSSLRWFGLVLLNGLLYRLFFHPEAGWASLLMGATFWAVAVYFFAGHHWDARDEEYCRLTARGDQA